jgi:hypothetical protein
MFKTLIYFISCGANYAPMAQRAIRSVRHYGMYTGDIAVLTDTPDEFTSGVDHVIDIRGELQRRPQHVPLPTYVYNMKTIIADKHPTYLYDFVLYMDSDTLVVSARFAPLVQSMSIVGGIWCQQNFYARIRSDGNPSQGGGLVTYELVRANPSISVCAGIVGFGADATDDLKAWGKACATRQYAADDQGLLHGVVAEHNQGRIHYLPKQAVWFPTNRVQSPIIYHFTNNEESVYTNVCRMLKL